MRKLAMLLVVLGLAAAPALAQDHSCVAGNTAYAQGDTPEEMNICTVTLSGGTFDNVATTTSVEKSVGISGVRGRLLQVILYSTNAATGTAELTISTATGLNGGTTLYNNTAINAYTPETGGAVYTSYLNTLPEVDFYDSDSTLWVRIYNGDVSSDDDFVVILVIGS